MNRKVLVGMSGGVDSSLAAFLLQQQGYEVVGVTLKLYKENPSCCNLDDMQDARLVGSRLGIPQYVLDIREIFEEKVIGYFIDSYLEGRTPNPCPRCNDTVKLRVILQKAEELGISWIATGHYARILSFAGKKILGKAKDSRKSQEYFLALVSDKILDRLILPLGDYSKEEVREKAREAGLEMVSDKKDSQEVCFIPDGDYFSFIQRYTGEKAQPGELVTSSGKVVGTHQGFYRYTLGQRRGIGVGLGKPQYVVRIEPEKNRVVIGDKDEVLKKRIAVRLLRSFAPVQTGEEYGLKIRYKSPAQSCRVLEITGDILLAEAREVFFAPTPGQLAVFYDSEKRVIAAAEILAEK